MQIDVRVMELLASKLCHDLVSPVSAINNGVELIEDIGGSVVDEAMKLIGDSAGHASRRLRLFRMAYGRAGGEENLGVKDMRQIAKQYIAGGKITLNWPEDQPVEGFVAIKGSLKVILNMIIMAEEILAYGGVVTMRTATGDPGTVSCRFEIVGRNAQLVPNIQAALEGTADVEELTPRSIQSYVTGRFAHHFGLQIKHDSSIPDRLDLILLGTPPVVATP